MYRRHCNFHYFLLSLPQLSLPCPLPVSVSHRHRSSCTVQYMSYRRFLSARHLSIRFPLIQLSFVRIILPLHQPATVNHHLCQPKSLPFDPSNHDLSWQIARSGFCDRRESCDSATSSWTYIPLEPPLPTRFRPLNLTYNLHPSRPQCRKPEPPSPSTTIFSNPFPHVSYPL